VNTFCPDGYLPAREAIVRAAAYCFPESFAALEIAAAPQSETKTDNGLEALARALSQPPVIPDALCHEFQDIINQTVHLLRNLLHQGELTAYYFSGLFGDGRHAVSSGFWATTAADGVMESGTYWPIGRPAAWHEQRPGYPLFLLQAELDALLSDAVVEKRPFPEARMPDLVAALLKMDDLSNRRDQHRALCELPQFRQYHITDRVFREAARRAPRRPGVRRRKSR
jgi:hypothetical protein